MLPHILLARTHSRLRFTATIPVFARPLSTKRRVENDAQVLEAGRKVAAGAGEVRKGWAEFGWVWGCRRGGGGGGGEGVIDGRVEGEEPDGYECGRPFHGVDAAVGFVEVRAVGRE